MNNQESGGHSAENSSEKFESLKRLLLEALGELRANENLFREILVRNLYEKLDNSSLLIEALVARRVDKHLQESIMSVGYIMGKDAAIDLLRSLVDEQFERIELLWKEITAIYPGLKIEEIKDDLNNSNSEELKKN